MSFSKHFISCVIVILLIVDILMIYLQGMVEAGVLKPVTVTWTPPPGFNVSRTYKCLQQNGSLTDIDCGSYLIFFKKKIGTKHVQKHL